MPVTWPIAFAIGTALVCVTVLCALGDVDQMTVVSLFSFVIGGALGHANGYRQGLKSP